MSSQTSGTEVEDRHVDWNLDGAHAYHFHPHLEESINRLKGLLPQLPEPHPFRMGPTGYVVMTAPVAADTVGQAQDENGRYIFIVGPRFLFQRYINGNVYCWTETWIAGGQFEGYFKEVPMEMWGELAKRAQRR